MKRSWKEKGNVQIRCTQKPCKWGWIKFGECAYAMTGMRFLTSAQPIILFPFKTLSCFLISSVPPLFLSILVSRKRKESKGPSTSADNGMAAMCVWHKRVTEMVARSWPFLLRRLIQCTQAERRNFRFHANSRNLFLDMITWIEIWTNMNDDVCKTRFRLTDAGSQI